MLWRTLDKNIGNEYKRGLLGWIPAVIIFLIISLVLLYLSDSADLSKFEPVLITINITMAIFAVNFAFSAYQGSDYRQFHYFFPPKLLYSFLSVVLLASVPLFALALKSVKVGAISIADFPVVALSSVFLLFVAKNETTPSTIIHRCSTTKNLEIFAQHFLNEADRRLLELSNIDLSGAADKPTHEWSWYVPPDAETDDPFNIIAGVAIFAINKRDVCAFQKAIESFLDSLERVVRIEPSNNRTESYKLKDVLQKHVVSAFNSITEGVVVYDKTGIFHQKFLDVCSLYLARYASEGLQASANSITTLVAMRKIASSCLVLGHSDIAIIHLVVSRQIVQKGIDRPPEFKNDNNGIDKIMFNQTLSQLPYMTVELGSKAIELSNSDFLYRCFDSYGWLGCSAIKQNKIEVGRTCLRALAQLGREAKATKLECFWDRCALSPTDHAKERIWWILSWLHHLQEQYQKEWLESIEEAYSRINGHKTTVECHSNGDKPEYSIKVSGDPHIVTYMTGSAFREIDYSDEKQLKDLNLY